VFLQHGLADSADCWVIHKAKVAPAFQLVRAGYDVWVGNSRGSKYNPSNNTKEFWEFSFPEMGKYDLKDQISTVLDKTGRQSLTFIGHDQGSSSMIYTL
jgi:lysosomal acid lipase/cholesteryl ester hydrolase